MEEELQRSSARRCIAAVATLAFLVAACRATAGSPPSLPVPSGLASAAMAAEDGLCRAAAALPDVHAARRAFENVAHAALHQLAAAPELGRPIAAKVLETMQVVERDIAANADGAALGPDLDALRASTDAAIAGLRLEAQPCLP